MDAGSIFLKPQVVETPIDVLVPTHNKLELTIKCINALYEHTLAPFNLIVVDDSTDLVTPIYFGELQKQHDNVTFIHSDEPYVCGNQLFNIGFGLAKTDFVATVMNSVTVEPEWEIIALKLMGEDPQIGVIGFKCLFPIEAGAGRIESAGISFVDYSPVDVAKGLPGHRQTGIYECPAVQWAFALVRKEAAIGNMAEGLYNGFKGWDDIDNCFVLKKEGWKVVYCGYGVGYHRPHATRGSNSDESHQLNKENGEIFYKSWGYWEAFKKANPDEPEFQPDFVRWQ